MKKVYTIDEGYYSRDLLFEDRLDQFLADVNVIVAEQLSRVDKRSFHKDRLVHSAYVYFKNSEVTCSTLTSISVKEDLLKYLSFSPYSSYTLVTDTNEDYIASVWDNGINTSPHKMVDYNKEISLIELYYDKDFKFILIPTECELEDFFFYYKSGKLYIYKYLNGELKELELQKFKESLRI